MNNPLSCSVGGAGGFNNPPDCSVTTSKIKQSWEDWDLFQIGGVIFF
jgi:hypothetical protein